jgi:hypothetical protein
MAPRHRSRERGRRCAAQKRKRDDELGVREGRIERVREGRVRRRGEKRKCIGIRGWILQPPSTPLSWKFKPDQKV